VISQNNSCIFINKETDAPEMQKCFRLDASGIALRSELGESGSVRKGF